MLDYLIVGLGLAGTAFCEELENHGKSFKVVSDNSQTSSLVAGGLYNPVILKRFTLSWKAREQLEIALPFYGALEKKLGTTVKYKIPVLRRFASPEEQNRWFEAADKPQLSSFLHTDIRTNTNTCIDAPFGYGEVLHTGRIDTGQLLSAYKDYLLDKAHLITETFDYDVLQLEENHIAYKTIKAKQIVFAEGFGLRQNPYFNHLPINGTKGEYLAIEAPDLKETNIIKANIFCIPQIDGHYLIGANYERNDKTNVPTKAAKAELLKKLDVFLKCNYKVVDQFAGVRPTVSDRRPLVGRHPKYKNLYVLNGFGSHGVMIAPYASAQLFELVEFKKAVHPEMDSNRFPAP